MAEEPQQERPQLGTPEGVSSASAQERLESGPEQVQQSAITEIISLVKGKDALPSELADAERELLDRLRSEVERARREHPEAAALNLDFSQNPEAYQIWSGLVNRMTQERMARGEAAGPLNESEMKQLVNGGRRIHSKLYARTFGPYG